MYDLFRVDYVCVCFLSVYVLCLCMFCVCVCFVFVYVLCLCMFCVCVELCSVMLYTGLYSSEV